MNYSTKIFLTNNWPITTTQIGGHGHEELEHRTARVTVHPYRNVRSLTRALSESTSQYVAYPSYSPENDNISTKRKMMNFPFRWN